MSLGIRSFAISEEENVSSSSTSLPPGIRIKDEGISEDPEEVSYMKDAGLPTSFGGGITKKGEKNTYYCDICLVELNSEDTMQV